MSYLPPRIPDPMPKWFRDAAMDFARDLLEAGPNGPLQNFWTRVEHWNYHFIPGYTNTEDCPGNK